MSRPEDEGTPLDIDHIFQKDTREKIFRRIRESVTYFENPPLLTDAVEIIESKFKENPNNPHVQNHPKGESKDPFMPSLYFHYESSTLSDPAVRVGITSDGQVSSVTVEQSAMTDELGITSSVTFCGLTAPSGQLWLSSLYKNALPPLGALLKHHCTKRNGPRQELLGVIQPSFTKINSNHQDSEASPKNASLWYVINGNLPPLRETLSPQFISKLVKKALPPLL